MRLEDRALLSAVAAPSPSTAAEVAPVSTQGNNTAAPAVTTNGGQLREGTTGALVSSNALGAPTLGTSLSNNIGGGGIRPSTQVPAPPNDGDLVNGTFVPVFVGGFSDGFYTGMGDAFFLDAIGNPYGNDFLGYGPEFSDGFSNMIGFDGFMGYGKGYDAFNVGNEFGVDLAYTPFQNLYGSVNGVNGTPAVVAASPSFPVFSTSALSTGPTVGDAGLTAGAVGFAGAGSPGGFGSGGGSGALSGTRLLITAGLVGGTQLSGGFGSSGGSGTSIGIGAGSSRMFSPLRGSDSGLFGQNGFGLFGQNGFGLFNESGSLRTLPRAGGSAGGGRSR